MNKRILSILALLLIPLPALSDGYSLHKECNQILQFAETGYLDENSVGGSFCMGMVNGMLALNSIYQSRLGKKALFCPPAATITNAEGAKLVVNYLDKHPEQMTSDTGSLMFFAFMDAYPCPAE